MRPRSARTLPTRGTVIDGEQPGSGRIESVYEGGPDGTVTDTLRTALGPLINFTIPALDAAVPLNPLDIIPPGFDVPLL